MTDVTNQQNQTIPHQPTNNYNNTMHNHHRDDEKTSDDYNASKFNSHQHQSIHRTMPLPPPLPARPGQQRNDISQDLNSSINSNNSSQQQQIQQSYHHQSSSQELQQDLFGATRTNAGGQRLNKLRRLPSPLSLDMFNIGRGKQ
jgi:hypothetical protein